MESPKILNQPATPILIFLVTIPLMFAVSGFESYDYMQYVVQWQPAVCSNPNNYREGCRKLAEQSFTIHGLWPSKLSGASVTYCKQGQAFDINKLHPIQAELDKCWPNMLGHNDDFWRSQWEKHGRCSLTVFRNQFEYFNRAVTLYNTYNKKIKHIVRGAQLYSGYGSWVESSDIANEIYNELGISPVLRCDYEYVSHPRQLRDYPTPLKEVILCFDVKGEVLIDCPPTMITNCGIHIYFSHELNFIEKSVQDRKASQLYGMNIPRIDRKASQFYGINIPIIENHIEV